MSNNTKFIIAALAIAFLLGLVTCKSCSGDKPVTTITKSDTVRTVKDSIIYVHDTVDNQKPVLVDEKPPLHVIDSFITFESSDTSQIVQPYLKQIKLISDKYNTLLKENSTTRTYRDTLKFKNGFAVSGSVVSKNKLQSQRIILDSIHCPLSTTTITNIVEQKRVIGYLGAHIQYGLKSGDILVGPSFSIKDKKDRVYGIYGHLGGIDKNAVGFEIHFPIRLRK